MIHIDGAQGEGGGQVLRSALALSALSGRPVTVQNIRAGRRNPGMAPQHLAGVRAAAQICAAETEGDALRSKSLVFRPGTQAFAGRYVFDIGQLAGTGSAGALTLLLQSILLPLALTAGNSHLILRGGTHVSWSPPLHYLLWVLMPALAKVGLNADIEIHRWGWYPKGGGEIAVTVHGGATLSGIQIMEKGKLLGLKGLAAASNLPSHIPQRISGRANNLLREAGLPSPIEPLRRNDPSTGVGLFMALDYENISAGFTSMGARGKASEVVADEGVTQLVAHTEQAYPLDKYLPDQLLLALALARGPSEIGTSEITQHTITNASIINHFLDREIIIKGQEGQPGSVQVRD